MENQLSFENMIEFSFWDNLNELLNDLINELELPKNSLHVFSNISHKGKNAGSETSKSICIYEPDYPMTKLDTDNPGKNYIVMNIQTKKSLELLIRNNQFNSIPLPASFKVKELKSDTTFTHVLVEFGDLNVFNYIKDNILYCLKYYSSKAKSFGCCSRFVECSDAKNCVHPNKLYATACTYKHNLDAGKIFYGKNKNV